MLKNNMGLNVRNFKKIELPDKFLVGTRWQVIKQVGGYCIEDLESGKNDEVLNDRLSRYLQALYSAQLSEGDGWISLDELVSLAIGSNENIRNNLNDIGTNTHNMQISNLRRKFSKGLIKNKPKNKQENIPSMYHLTQPITPIPDFSSDNDVNEKPGGVDLCSERDSLNGDARVSSKTRGDKKLRYVKLIGIPVVMSMAFASAFFSDILNIYEFFTPSQSTKLVATPSLTEERIAPVKYDLSLRYSTGSTEEYVFESGQVLNSGDQFRLTLQPEKSAYLYIFYSDSSNNVHVLFPPAEKNNLPTNYHNPVDAMYALHLPSIESAYRLDDNVGHESITIISVDKEIDEISELDKVRSSEVINKSEKLPGMPAKISRVKLEQVLLNIRKRFAKTCPTCVKTIDIIHR